MSSLRSVFCLALTMVTTAACRSDGAGSGVGKSDSGNDPPLVEDAAMVASVDVGSGGAPISIDAGTVAGASGGVMSGGGGSTGNGGVGGSVSTTSSGGTTTVTSVCAKATCTSLGATCGDYSDGCGAMLHCGLCAAGQICDRTSKTCGAPTAVCSASDACGYLLDVCGNGFACSKTCATGTHCVHNRCTACDAVVCTGRCGNIPDGCGATTNCGGCPTGQACDALTFTCQVCQKVKCTDYPAGTCGTLSDGCGGVLTCTCPASTTPPPVCVAAGAQCGKISDDCVVGVTHDCGPCAAGKICNNNTCVTCTPITCAAAGKNCGSLDDGCGGKLACGTCKTNEICTSNVCTACTPKTCASAGKNCGTLDDGCGGKLTCGTCKTNEICSANLCATCVPKTCAGLERTCGKIDDGCGHTVTCPGCAAGQVCLSNGSCCQPATCGDELGMVPDGCGGVLQCLGN